MPDSHCAKMPRMDRIYRVEQDGQTFYAVERDGELRRASGDPFSGGGEFQGGTPVRGGLGGVRVLAPVRPSKIVCVGLNYKDHAAEVGKALPAEPLLFIKPTSAVIGPGEAIRIPPGVGPRRSRGRAGHRHRPARAPRAARPTPGITSSA